MLLAATVAQGQIVIGGNVYGGGNLGNTTGNTNVTIHAGDINRVFGGARIADVGGRAFVHLDGEHASNYILINYVYGGNDISGTIGTGTLPSALTRYLQNGITSDWNAFVRISSKMTATVPATIADDNQKIYVGQLFGGGNGDYDYVSEYANKNKPDLGKTYLEILGGSIVSAFGGGNSATVTDSTVICVENPSEVVNGINDPTNPNADENGELITTERITNPTTGMGLNPGYTYATSAAYQIGSFFGGNNKVEMGIRPKWNLLDGKIRTIYSGGNEGSMTRYDGLLVEIPENSNIEVGDIFGGCRKADVCPQKNGVNVLTVPNLAGYRFPDDFAARVLVRGGKVHNVYGGNDISGHVYFGCAVGVYTSITGDIYGGGNGSYPYTDNPDLANDPTYRDLYYTLGGKTSVDALNDFRPNAEQVSIRLYSPNPLKPTTIHGRVFCGGNSASVKTLKSNAKVELKIGSNVIADQVFLGNNGENMVAINDEVRDDNNAITKHEGVLKTMARTDITSNSTKFSSIDLTQSNVFAKYMEGCAMTIIPRVVFDTDVAHGGTDPDNYVPYSSYIGSFYCGGNVGSMISEGTSDITFKHELVIFDKVVGGCNKADVPEQKATIDGATVTLNAAYQGGIIGSAEEQASYTDNSGNIKDRLVLNFNGLKIQPKRWNATQTELIWNTVDINGTAIVPDGSVTPTKDDDPKGSLWTTYRNHRLKGGNIYGGCYTSGHVNGNVVINLNNTLIDRDELFDHVEEDELGEAVLYGNEGLGDLLTQDTQTYNITERRTGVILGRQGMDVLGKALNVFGGGYGPDTEIWGSTTINLNAGYTFQIFGGGENGVIGKPTGTTTADNGTYSTDEDGNVTSYAFNGKTYAFNDKYTSTVNLCGKRAGVSKKDESGETMAEAEFIYGGGFFAPICGNTIVNLGDGRVFNTFAGSCMADILGHSETYVGRQVVNTSGANQPFFPYVRDYVYGGNDLGGKIFGEKDFRANVRNDVSGMLHSGNSTNVTTASSYIEYRQGRAMGIFGGCFGTYDYKDSHYREFFDTDGNALSGYSKPRMGNAFVNFRPESTADLQISVKKYNFVKEILGAGEGYPDDADRDIMQKRSYVLIDIPQEMENYKQMDVFGAGAWSGLGMDVIGTGVSQSTTDAATLDGASAIIDLTRGQINAAYGGSFNEGFTRRTVVNVPSGSTIQANSIFAGAYGADFNVVCDVYEGNLNYNSGDARVASVYGGNNNAGRVFYGRVNINKPVKYLSDQYGLTWGTVYGAGYGLDTWSQYTEVNLNDGAEVYDVYGGGQKGRVMNKSTIEKYAHYDATLDLTLDHHAKKFNKQPQYVELGLSDEAYQPVVRSDGKKHNTNVIINRGASVGSRSKGATEYFVTGGYVYGGGLGDATLEKSGDVNGTTYVELNGGTVWKDLYAAGKAGSVLDEFGNLKDEFNKDFVASTTAYVLGGTVRNVYGGGYMGNVGKHKKTVGQKVVDADISDSTDNDIDGETNVIIGKADGTGFYNGIPAIQRNAYGGGEGDFKEGGKGGAVWGKASVKLFNGRIGYEYLNGKYEEKLNDETWAKAKGDSIGRLVDYGNIFGGGYSDNSYVDESDIEMWGGHVRGCLIGGGEIAPIGRGTISSGAATIYKAGHTSVKMYNGHVEHNVFGGGKGYNVNGFGGLNNLGTDGYIFGQTNVCIYGGEVGLEDVVDDQHGNVFGGGDRGFIYSAYNGGRGVKSGTRYNRGLSVSDAVYDDEGYYYKHDGTKFVEAGTDGKEKQLTEDCKVLIEPHCLATSEVTIKTPDPEKEPTDEDYLVDVTYPAGSYVPTDALNTLKNKSEDAAKWGCLDDKGIIIHNAVFAGGNVSSGTEQVSANDYTVFGNATASIHDLYHRDLITIGSGHTGGLYGDGNLTLVDGYRGLNITNYGTDYYNLRGDISYSEYDRLSEREKAYYEIKYECMRQCTDNEGKTYYPADGDKAASTITFTDLMVLFNGVQVNGVYIIDPVTSEINDSFWEQNGVCSRYAGRIMNTIQRADFCGVFGSRMVMQGAPDRVPETVDYTNYTINRVREVSLNKKSSIAGDTGDEATHGNYFGIYSVVNYLGALTSDVHFSDVRTTGSVKYPADGTTSFSAWKAEMPKDQRRNNGTSHNKVALASGVYLELTTELSTGTSVEQKDWGYITGVIELDLINVQTGIGGGYVYAKNVHGTPTYNRKHYSTLTALNANAVTRKDYTYSDDNDSSASDIVEWETSGNFVHDTQTIIDDCYAVSNKYKGSDRSRAHYWYVKGQVYVYDQYISAFTGAPTAYQQAVNIPLTISAASHGKMKLVNVQPNYYAYYTDASQTTPISGDNKLTINDVEYTLNAPITYWDWSLLTPSQRALFVRDTYVTIAECKLNGTTYPEGTVLRKADVDALRAAAPKDESDVPYVTQTTTNAQGNSITKQVDFDYVFRPSNNLSHDTGYLLTYDVNNPALWNDWYTPKTGAATDKISTAEYRDLPTSSTDPSVKIKSDYHDGPTYQVKEGETGIYGQSVFAVSSIIDNEVYTTYQTMKTNYPSIIPANQATFEDAYIVTVDEVEAKKITTRDDNGDPTAYSNIKLYKGASLSMSEYTTSETTWPEELAGKVARAYVCTSTIQLTNSEQIFTGDLMTEAQKNDLLTEYASNTSLCETINKFIVPAYYCTSPGSYGGDYYTEEKNYRGLAAWSAMSAADREHFTFNYDALDLLIDPSYGGTESQKYQYDAAAATLAGAQANKAHYSLEQSVDYTATYDGTTDITYNYKGSSKTIKPGDPDLTREEFEAIPNEQYHYAPISVTGAGDYYVVKESFIRGETPFAVGSTITPEVYSSLGDDQAYIATITVTSEDVADLEENQVMTYYFCRSSYTVGEHGEGESVTSVKGVNVGHTYEEGDVVPVGVVIAEGTKDTENTYMHLVNWQREFTIHGIAPVETSTLYVSRNSDIFDLSQEKIITVIYQYDYEEVDATGTHVTPVSERHVLNIHLQFKSGIPSVDNIAPPDLVLPGTNIVIPTPNVKPGAYEVVGGGWELYADANDAESHMNGIEYTPSNDPLYWYEDGYYVSYYAKTYLGKTFSNAVQVNVANYHDLKKVMDDVQHHYYIDHEGVKRDPKIYINDYSKTSENGLTMLKDLFNLSTVSAGTSPLSGHALLNTTQVGDLKNLEFFLRTDLSAPSAPSGTPAWTSIGDANHCFEGTLHGDGHTISGLDNSLFSHLCGEVYNLGVTGSFTTAGIADNGTGFLENCWVKSTETAASGVKAVFNDPRNTATRTTHLVNCYYPSSGGFASQTGTIGKSDRAFYSGEVAYDLNEFYLFKRYCDNTTPAISGNDYFYWKNENGTLTRETGHYSDVAGPYLVKNTEGTYLGIGSYVESRYYDGDFIYAGGEIGAADPRLYIDTEHATTAHYPIWPDDYLFFGQRLIYGHDIDPEDVTAVSTHQSTPAVITKIGERLPTADNNTTSNRVYRAPAYTRSKQMGLVYFNPNAVFAKTNIRGNMDIHKNMTAIDFTGGNNDLSSGYKRVSSEAPYNYIAGGVFYPPLLDDGGIFSFNNYGLTKNLLVYTGEPGGTGSDETPTASQQTANTVSATLLDEAYVETDNNYHTVDVWDSNSDNVLGHWVQGSPTTSYTATRDHNLVDKQDFNAPIAYTFDGTHRMWYQRTPEATKYVTTQWVDHDNDNTTPLKKITKGWDVVSLPFKAEIVTTQDKGELSHFYEGSTHGHEYWLRRFTGGNVSASDSKVFEATLEYPAANSGDGIKHYTNTFLWDYYYHYDNNDPDEPGVDINNDSYQKKDENITYYKDFREYENYPRLAAAKPYLIGLPGSTYYEFDLSGEFIPKNSLETPGKLDPQVITFASDVYAAIGVSDDETLPGGSNFAADNTHSNYTFRPSYMNESIAAGTNTYILKADGSQFDKVPAASESPATPVPDTEVYAFRPYFMTGVVGNARPTTRSIIFGNEQSEIKGVVERGDPTKEEAGGTLYIYAQKHKIIVESSLNYTTDVRIVNLAGITINSFTIEPGQTIETRVNSSGVYIVEPSVTRYIKKLSVR